MAAILQTIFSDAFFVNEKFCIFLKVSLKFVPNGDELKSVRDRFNVSEGTDRQIGLTDRQTALTTIPFRLKKLKGVKFTLVHWNRNAIILTIFSLLAAPEVVKMTTSGAASNENIVKMTTFLFQLVATNSSRQVLLLVQRIHTKEGASEQYLIKSLITRVPRSQ